MMQLAASSLRRSASSRVRAVAPLAARAYGGAAGSEKPSGLILSPGISERAARGLLEGIDLMVCDMAGTTVAEGGIVYKTLQSSMGKIGLNVSDAEIRPWFGAKKEAVIEHFARQAGLPDAEVEAMVTSGSEIFEESIDKAYFSPSSVIASIDPRLPEYFKVLRKAGMRIALDTGYPQHIQQGLVQRLGYDQLVDAYISSYEVAEGRPYPYMVHRLMERLRVMDVRRVCKVGDSARDIEEGRNAGCGLVVGVLSGADDAETLMAAGADVVAPCVTDLPLPRNALNLMDEPKRADSISPGASEPARATM